MRALLISSSGDVFPSYKQGSSHSKFFCNVMKLLYIYFFVPVKETFNRTKVITSTITGDVNLTLKCSCWVFFKYNELISNQYDIIRNNDATKMKDREKKD